MGGGGTKIKIHTPYS